MRPATAEAVTDERVPTRIRVYDQHTRRLEKDFAAIEGVEAVEAVEAIFNPPGDVNGELVTPAVLAKEGREAEPARTEIHYHIEERYHVLDQDGNSMGAEVVERLNDRLEDAELAGIRALLDAGHASAEGRQVGG